MSSSALISAMNASNCLPTSVQKKGEEFYTTLTELICSYGKSNRTYMYVFEKTNINVAQEIVKVIDSQITSHAWHQCDLYTFMYSDKADDDVNKMKHTFYQQK